MSERPNTLEVESPKDLAEANEIIGILRSELAAVAVAVGRSDQDGYDVDWFGLASDVAALKTTQSETAVHTDHPLRHFDRTCPGCIAENSHIDKKSETPRTDAAAVFEERGVKLVTADFARQLERERNEQGRMACELLDEVKRLQAAQSANTALAEIAAERQRQREKEGWDDAHDDEHEDGSLAAAAASYALPESQRIMTERTDHQPYHRYSDDPVMVPVKTAVPTTWPLSWAGWFWKPKDRRRDLIRAGALIVAELERLDRQASTQYVLHQDKENNDAQ